MANGLEVGSTGPVLPNGKTTTVITVHSPTATSTPHSRLGLSSSGQRTDSHLLPFNQGFQSKGLSTTNTEDTTLAGMSEEFFS